MAGGGALQYINNRDKAIRIQVVIMNDQTKQPILDKHSLTMKMGMEIMRLESEEAPGVRAIVAK
jgi:hypothetical protein